MWSRWTEAQGDAEEAVRILELLIGEGKEHWKVKVELAYIELRRGEELNSKLYFMDATEDAYADSLSAGSEVVIKYSRFLSVQGEAVEAELLLEQALEKNPTSVKLNWALVNYLSAEMEHDRVIQCLKSAIFTVRGANRLEFYKELISYSEMLGVSVSEILKIEKSFKSCCDVFKGKAGEFQCYHCDAVLSTRFNLKRHKVLMHESGADLECERCLSHFDTGELMMKHKQKTIKCFIKCVTCSYKSKNKKKFESHVCAT